MSKLRAVFDCNVIAQALLNRGGPAGACLDATWARRFELYISEFMLAEIRKLPEKPTPRRLGLTPEKAEAVIAALRTAATLIATPPALFEHPLDSKDSSYVDLALAAGADMIVSRDRHMLNLVNPAKPWSADFRARFPGLRMMSPEAFLQELRDEKHRTGDD